MERLTKKQYDFCIHYIKNGFNAYEAALSAGYSQTYASSRAHELVNKPTVHKQLSKSYKKAEENLNITFEWKLSILQRIIHAFMPEDKQPSPQHAKAVIQAISELNRMQGDFAPKKQLNVSVDATLQRLAEVRRVYEEY